MHYTQASLEDKKHDVAGKMKHPMSGNKPSFQNHRHQKYTMNAHGNKGEKYREGGQKTPMGRGERPTQEGGKVAKRIPHTMNAVQPQYEGGEKFPQANKKGNFSSNYTQHGK